MSERKELKKKNSTNIFKKIWQFFKELSSESKKVVWPSRSQLINNSLIVFAFVLASGVVVWGLDTLFSFLIQLAYKL